MVAYNEISAARKASGAELDESLFEDLDQNPVAIAEGASGAPQFKRAAFIEGVGHRWFYDYGDGTDGAVTDSANRTADPGLYQYTTYQLNASYTLDLSQPGPLVICAQDSIIINGTIDVDGQGGIRGWPSGVLLDDAGDGYCGGSGGGGNNGAATTKPGGTFKTPGVDGSAGAAQASEIIDLLLASPAAFLMLQKASISISAYTLGGPGGGGGGSSQADYGGNGGGLVVLCAPVITINSGGVITADGLKGEETQGGGGGGGAIIIATPASGYTNSGTVAAAAGPATSSGYAGGAGWVREITL